MADHFNLVAPDELPADDVVGVVDWLLGEAIDASPSVLKAEIPIGEMSEGDPVYWRLIEQHSPETSKVVMSTHGKSTFRALLARIGAHYLDGQLYHGHALVTVNYRGDDYQGYIYMGNCSHTGFWAKIFFVAVSGLAPE